MTGIEYTGRSTKGSQMVTTNEISVVLVGATILCVSRLLKKDFNPMKVAAITWHRTLQMLARYTHLRARGSGREVWVRHAHI